MNQTIIITEKQIPGLTGLTPELDDAAAAKQPDRRTGVVFKGIPAWQGRAKAPAVVFAIGDPLPKLTERSILVCAYPAKEIIPLLPRLDGLVTERGGLLSRTVNTAREYDVPVVLGIDSATERIRTGDLVGIDGTMGTVEITG